MTPTEATIYGTVYAMKLAENMGNPPRDIHLPKNEDKYTQWEQDQRVNAAEYAAYAVVEFQEMGPVLQEGWGDDSPVFTLWLEAIRR